MNINDFMAAQDNDDNEIIMTNDRVFAPCRVCKRSYVKGYACTTCKPDTWIVKITKLFKA